MGSEIIKYDGQWYIEVDIHSALHLDYICYQGGFYIPYKGK